MAHELEIVNGVASTFSVNETPWHKEGVILAAAPDYETAIRLGRLDYEVVKVAARVPVNPSDPNGEYRISENCFAVMRTDTGAELGSVGKDYCPVQNSDAFGVLRPLVDSGVLKLETGGVLRGGADAWLLGKWDIERFGPVVKEVFADEVIPFSTICANHSGRRGILLGNTPIRIVCANTLGMAESAGGSRWETIRHVGDAKERLLDAAENMFKGIIERYEVIATQYKALRARILTQAEFEREVLAVIAPDPRLDPAWNPEAKMANMVVERFEKKVATLGTLWAKGRGHVGDRSAWEAYNGAVEALDHNVDGLWPNRAGVYRTASLLGGTYGGMKDRVLDNLYALAVAA